MPFLSGNDTTGKGRLTLEAHPSALWPDESYTPSQDYTPALERAHRVEPLNHGCGNPRCSTSWAKPWKNRRRPIFEDRWGCGARCLEAMIEAAVRREFGDGVAAALPEPHRHRVPLGLVMLAHGWITHPQLQRALEGQREAGTGKIGYWLQQECGVPDETVTRALSVQWSCPVLAPGGFAPRAMALVMPRLFVEEFGLVPLRITPARTLYLASEDRLDASAAFALKTMSGLDVESGLLRPETLASTRERLLACEPVKATEENVRNSESMTTRIAALLAEAQPVRARLVRFHRFFWLRTWLEADGHGQQGTVPTTAEDVMDTVFTIGVQSATRPRLAAQAPAAAQPPIQPDTPLIPDTIGLSDVVALPPVADNNLDPAELEARLQPLVAAPAPPHVSAPALHVAPSDAADECLDLVHLPAIALSPELQAAWGLIPTTPAELLDPLPYPATLALDAPVIPLALGAGDAPATALVLSSSPIQKPTQELTQEPTQELTQERIQEPTQATLPEHRSLPLSASAWLSLEASPAAGSLSLATMEPAALVPSTVATSAIALRNHATLALVPIPITELATVPTAALALRATETTSLAVATPRSTSLSTIPTAECALAPVTTGEISLAITCAAGTVLAATDTLPHSLVLADTVGLAVRSSTALAIATEEVSLGVSALQSGDLPALGSQVLPALEAPTPEAFALGTPTPETLAAPATLLGLPHPAEAPPSSPDSSFPRRSLLRRLLHFLRRVFLPWRP